MFELTWAADILHILSVLSSSKMCSYCPKNRFTTGGWPGRSRLNLLTAGTERAYHFNSFCQSTETRGAPPSGLEGGSWVFRMFLFPNPGHCHAQRIKALLRPRGSALHHLQLLPAAAFSGKQWRAESFCARTRARPPGIRSLAFGICGHAGACACADRRAAAGHAFNGVADVKAASVAQNAEEEAKPTAGTAAPELSPAARESAQLLASAVLRFQRKHKTENKRETRVHAS